MPNSSRFFWSPSRIVLSESPSGATTGNRNQEPKREALEAVEEGIAHAERKAAGLARTLQALMDTDPAGPMVQALKQYVDQTNALYREQVERGDRLAAGLAAQVLTDERIEEVMEYACNVHESIAHADYEAKRQMIEALGVKVRVKDGWYHLRCVLGEAEGEIGRYGRKNLIVQASRSRSLQNWIIGFFAADVEPIRVAPSVAKTNSRGPHGVVQGAQWSILAR